jgi:integrase
MAIRRRNWKTPKGEQREAWIVDYTDQRGERHIKTFATRREAADWAAQARQEVRAGTHTANSGSLTVVEAFTAWIENCTAEGLERSTIEQRRSHLTHHVAPFIGNVKLAELTAPRVRQFIDQLRDAGRSLALRKKIRTNLGTVLRFAQERGLVAQNVVAGMKVKANKRDAISGSLRAGVDFPTKAEMKALIDHAPDRWRPLIITAIFTGMRISELRGLMWSDVDLARGIVFVRQRADAWRVIGAPKSAAAKRDVPLAPLVINTLKAWKLACPKGELNLVFPNGVGKPLTVPNLRDRVLGPLQAAAGISPAFKPKYGWHSLRHAAASLFIEQLGWSPKRLQAVMGHASIQMTFDHYGHLFEQDHAADRTAMAKIEAALRAV